MKIEAWPFLIGRNRSLGYQTIVSPQFLSERDLSTLLAEAAGGDESGPGDAIYRQILGSEVGDISLIFRVVRAKAQDYNLGEDETLRDRGGRPILLIEGFLVREHESTIKVTRDDLQTAHNLVKAAYEKFWYADNTFKEIASLPFDLPTDNHSSEQMRLIVEAPLKLRPHPFPNLKLVLVALIVLTVLIIGGIVAYIPSTSTPSTPSSTPTDTPTPVPTDTPTPMPTDTPTPAPTDIPTPTLAPTPSTTGKILAPSAETCRTRITVMQAFSYPRVNELEQQKT